MGTINFSDFTNLSSVTKTLCNRLIPTEITAKYIKEHGVIEADQERNMMSQELKNILNDFYRNFLSENLVKVHELDFKPLFTEMKKYLETKNNKEALEKAQDDREKPSMTFSRAMTDIKICSRQKLPLPSCQSLSCTMEPTLLKKKKRKCRLSRCSMAL